MTSSTVETVPVAGVHVEFKDDALVVDLTDGRKLSVPLAWYPRLMHATAAEREAYWFQANGAGIHWNLLDEDISVANLLAGRPSAESQKSLKRWLATRGANTPE